MAAVAVAIVVALSLPQFHFIPLNDNMLGSKLEIVHD